MITWSLIRLHDYCVSPIRRTHLLWIKWLNVITTKPNQPKRLR
ncbi:unnamed protein product [Oppiella nova]|uniref:Uncharacterized protein n=1 Tax=Oppiella nova TaxID=334625 RepID=A0A7R9R2B4_9ACAR|nr:unnamed protein product [Oppiella nova]CAG2183128.1 unnamed protein product [Oppiella nova]